MQILQYPNDSLRQETKSIEKVTSELQQIAKEMFKVMLDNKGVGLAAPQVGLDIKLIVISDMGQPLYMFNPVILKKSPKKVSEKEGCLSFTGLTQVVSRPEEITVKYRDFNNKMQYGTYKGFVARIIQHEIDHLSKKLFIDYENNA